MKIYEQEAIQRTDNLLKIVLKKSDSRVNKNRDKYRIMLDFNLNAVLIGFGNGIVKVDDELICDKLNGTTRKFNHIRDIVYFLNNALTIKE